MYEVQKMFHYQFLEVDGFKISKSRKFDFHKKKGKCKQVWDIRVHGFSFKKKKKTGSFDYW